MIFRSAVLAIVLLFPGVGVASACNRCGNFQRCQFAQHHVAHHNNFVAVPFAYPVGVAVTVAPVSYVDYHAVASVGYGSTYESSYRQEYQRPKDWTPAYGKTAGPSPTPRATPLVAQHCAGCHNGQNPKTKLNLLKVWELSDGARRNAIGRIHTHDMAKVMPKGNPLPLELRDAISAELSMLWDAFPGVEKPKAVAPAQVAAPAQAEPAPAPAKTKAPGPESQTYTLSMADLEEVVERVFDRRMAKREKESAEASEAPATQ